MKNIILNSKGLRGNYAFILAIVFILTVLTMDAFNQVNKENSESKINCTASPDRWTSLLYSCAEKETIVPANGSRMEVTAGGQGAISIKSWDRNEIKIRAVSEAWAKTDEMAQKNLGLIDYKFDGNKLVGVSSVEKVHENPWAVNFEITIPNNYDITLNTVNGAIFVEGFKGDIMANAMNGAVYLTKVGGKVNAKSLNGRVEVKILDKSWDGESLNIESGNGDVAIYFPKDFSGQLDSRTGSGKIYIQEKIYVYNTLKKTLNEGGKLLTLRSGNGNINVLTFNPPLN